MDFYPKIQFRGGDIRLAIRQVRKLYVLEKAAMSRMANQEASALSGISVRPIQRGKAVSRGWKILQVLPIDIFTS